MLNYIVVTIFCSVAITWLQVFKYEVNIMNKKDWQGILNALGLLTQLGIIMVINIGVGFFLGYILDNFMGREYIFKITGLLLGVGSGFYSNYKLIVRIINNNHDSDDNE